MALNFPKLPGVGAANAKTRVFIILAGVVGIGVLIYVAIRFLGGGGDTAGPSRVANAPAGLQSVPGSQLTPEYYQALKQANVQATQQAQISGGSAVPTLVNVPGQQSSFGSSTNCGVVCPGDDKIDVSNDINDLVRQAKLSQEEANRLLALAKNNMPVDEYAAQLAELVRQGKLTPEQARKMLEDYMKQHANALLADSAQSMDAFIKSGQLPLSTANDLLALQKKNLTPEEYAAELERLAREGKISPALAAQLLAQYTQQKKKEAAKQGAFELKQMAKAGQVTPDVAKTLADLQSRNIPLDQYNSTLARLVADGKLTPAVAAKLAEQYRKQRIGGAENAGAMKSLVAQGDAASAPLAQLLAQGGPQADEAKRLLALQNTSPDQYAAEIKRAVAAGLIPPAMADKLLASAGTPPGVMAQLMAQGGPQAEEAKRLLAMQESGVTPQEYADEIKRAVAAGILSPQAAAQLLNQGGARLAAKRLLTLQGNNAPLQDYTEELKRLVAAGIISPDMAAQLLREYQASITPFNAPATGVAPTAQLNIPGAEDFAKLQQRLQQQQTQPAAVPTAPAVSQTAQFTAAQAQSEADAAAARQQRVQELEAAMSSQAQQLINTAWVTPKMQHVAGSADAGKLIPVKPGGGTSGGPGGGGEGGGAGASTGFPLVKAGTILFAVLDTAVDSDYPDTPVLATIIQGDLKGAKLMGKVQTSQGPNQDKVALTFTTMGMDSWPTNKSINAFAIDPDTARTVMASEVDHHYLTRYGALMAVSFLSGYSSAITNAGTSTTGIFGTSTTHNNLSPAAKIAVGLGQIGTNLTGVVQNYTNIPLTVKVHSGVGLGILFMSDVTQ